MLKFYYERWYFSPYMSSVKLPGCFSALSAEMAEWCCMFHPQCYASSCPLYSLYCDQTLLFWDAGLKRLNSPFCYESQSLSGSRGKWTLLWTVTRQLLGIRLPSAWLLSGACPIHVRHVLARKKEQHFHKQEKTELQATRLGCFLLSCSTWSPVFNRQQGILQIAFSGFILLSWFGVKLIYSNAGSRGPA